MRVVKVKDIIHVLELNLETNEAAGIVLDLLDYEFEIENAEDGCKECKYSWWNGENYECSRPTCRFDSKEVEFGEMRGKGDE